MGGIVIILVIIVVVVGGLALFFLAGGAEALRHRPGGDLNPDTSTDGSRPMHREVHDQANARGVPPREDG